MFSRPPPGIPTQKEKSQQQKENDNLTHIKPK